MFARKQELVSPLKSKPWRNPGQSLSEQIHKIEGEDTTVIAAIVAAPTGFAIYEWIKWWAETPPRPGVISVVALICIVYGIRQVFLTRTKLRKLRQGRDGEIAVGQFLERMREQGYHVFHDIVSSSFNVDHVVIGPSGVYIVETKTFSKPKGPNARVLADERSVVVAGNSYGAQFYNQCQAQAKWIRDLLKESTGRSFFVQPILVFPGWMVMTKGRQDVWVMNPKSLPQALESRKATLSPEDVKLAVYHLSRHVRSDAIPTVAAI